MARVCPSRISTVVVAARTFRPGVLFADQAAVDLAELGGDLQADAVLIDDRRQEADDRAEGSEVGRHGVEPHAAHDRRHGELAAGDERGRAAAERDERRLAEQANDAPLLQDTAGPG